MEMAEKKHKRFIGIDQYGNYFPIKKYPRKELLEHLGYHSANVMYMDYKDGSVKASGYVIGTHWITIYQLQDWK